MITRCASRLIGTAQRIQSLSRSPVLMAPLANKRTYTSVPHDQVTESVSVKETTMTSVETEESLQQAREANKLRFKQYMKTLAPLAYPVHYVLKCVSENDAIEEAIQDMLNSGEKAFGFDMEWPPTFVKGEKEKKTSLIQICSSNKIILLQIGRLKALPPVLCQFLADRSILKTGVGIRGDALKLHRDYGVITNGLVDLSTMAHEYGKTKLQSTNLRSLQALSALFLEQQMPKGKVRCSNWNAVELTPRQQAYAANDAYASYALYHVFKNVRDEMKAPLPPKYIIHISDETLPPPKAPTTVNKKTTERSAANNKGMPKATITVIKPKSTVETNDQHPKKKQKP
ncbi:ribonuclease H-like domain-containing protein [Radiomyces spectabilis]|uniref:ribonuclease H-like domain-containing protein n=1 Tax=Radiomyces spectabilis TaxID=64574 RepID=UPI00221ECA17|nr:ribonuclease H-like domain-containing protein [Radiomyces spectabilis]KAI8391730.1 ribonuclease H-like domain-containing protein [Radiomyces spectabilis]